MQECGWHRHVWVLCHQRRRGKHPSVRVDPERIPTSTRCESKERTGQVSHRVLNVRPCPLEFMHSIGVPSRAGVKLVQDEATCAAAVRRRTSMLPERSMASCMKCGPNRSLPSGLASIVVHAAMRLASTPWHHVLFAGAPLQEFVFFPRRIARRPSSRHVLRHVVGARVSIETLRGDGGTWRTQDRAVRRGRHAHAAAEGARWRVTTRRRSEERG